MQQFSFSSLLFDTLFGLIVFFGLDSFLEIKEPIAFAFYIFSNIILIHWWLLFKSVDDTFGKEVENSVTDLLFGLVYVIRQTLYLLLQIGNLVVYLLNGRVDVIAMLFGKLFLKLCEQCVADFLGFFPFHGFIQ